MAIPLLVNTLTLKTFGQSMQPLFRDGDVISIKKIPYKKIEIDDIVTFLRNKKLISHRVVYKTDKYLVTTGDNNFFVDKKVTPKQIIGKVVSVKRLEESILLDSIYLYQSSIYWRELALLNRFFKKNGINYLFLKGLPLHLFYGKKIPRRIYADCDLLVAKNDISQVEDLLTKLSYKKEYENNRILPAFLEKERSEITFNKLIKKVVVSLDLHTEVAFLMKSFGDLDPLYPKKLNEELTEEFFRSKQTVSIESEQFPVLSLPKLILYLALHLFSHNLKGHHRFEQLSFLLRKQTNLNVLELAKDINVFKLNSYVYPVFILMSKYYKIKFPIAFLRSIAPDEGRLVYIKRRVLSGNSPFGIEQKWDRGAARFKHIFYLSPNKLTNRVLIFFKPHIIYAIFWVMTQKIKTALLKQVSF